MDAIMRVAKQSGLISSEDAPLLLIVNYRIKNEGKKGRLAELSG
jgi:hypothetical protein